MGTAQESIKTLESIKNQLENQVRIDFCVDLANLQGCDIKSMLPTIVKWHKKFRRAYARKFRYPLPSHLNSSQIELDIEHLISKNDENCKLTSNLPIKTTTTKTATFSKSTMVTTSTEEITTLPVTTTTTARTLATSTITKTTSTSSMTSTSLPAPTSKSAITITDYNCRRYVIVNTYS